jgi:transposase-like protein
MSSRWQKAAEVLERAEDDILAYMAFPQKHWTRIYSTNPLERLNKEVKRRTKVVGVFPDQPSVIRLVGSILMETDDEWQAAERRYFSLETMRELTHPEVLLKGLGPLRLAPIH